MRSEIFRSLRFVAVLAALSGSAFSGETETLARQIFEGSGIRGGIVVQLGCGDGHLTAALRPTPSYHVQALDRDPQNVAATRAFLQKEGVYGEISVDRFDGTLMPYIDNLVNLVVAEDLGAVTLDEVKRVLVPDGVAYVKQGGAWQKIVKQRSADLDEWTHYFYDARGNAVSKDLVVAPPQHLQWVGNPRWSRHHDRMSSLSAMVTAGGRLFYIMDQGSRMSILMPSKWTLTARDAFNGTILWEKPIEKWQSQLWPLKSGPTELVRRMVTDGAHVYVTMGIDAPVSCLDAASGQETQVYPGTKGAEEILVSNGVLYVLVNPKEWALEDFAPKFNTGDQGRVEKEFNWDQKPREIVAVEAASGRVLWKKSSAKIAPLTLATDSKRLVYYDGDKLVCLDPATGEQRWASAPEARRKLYEYNFAPRVVLHDNAVLYAGGDGSMKGVDADSGKDLWNAPHSKSGYRSPEDLIVAAGLVWNAPTTEGNLSGIFTGRDPVTGEKKVEFPPDSSTFLMHHRCYIAKATERFIIPSRTGIEFVDLKAKHWDYNHWVRGACLYGIIPANGLVYAGPHDCACYPEAKLFGMNALAPGTVSKAAPLSEEQRFERGPAFAEKLAETEADPKDWPAYRHDSARSGYSNQPLADDLGKAWEIALGGRLSQPVIAARKLFVSQIDRHTLFALDAGSGKELWRFVAGARVDSPPAYWKGRVFFGSMDGWVYCLRADDGALVWRYHAAPAERRHVAFEQIESVWPVHGSVVVEDGVVSCVAGRSVFLDGGLRFIRLDAATGKKLVETVFDDKDPETGNPLQSRLKGLQMPVGLNDILSTDGKFLYLRSQKIGMDGLRVEIGPVSGNAVLQGAAQKGEGAHCFAPMGFVDDSWFHRSYWVYGKNFAGGYGGYFQAGKYTPSGRILVFDDKNVYGFGREPQYFKWTTTMEHQLFAEPKEAPNVEPQAEGRGNGYKRIGNKAKNAPPEYPAVRFPKADKLDPSNTPLTVEVWIMPDGKDGILVTHGGAANGFVLALQDGKPGFSVRISGEVTTAGAGRALGEGWHHIAGVLGANKKLRLFVDGQLAAETGVPSLIPKNPALGLQIGAPDSSAVTDYGNETPYTGLLDEFAIFHRALSEGEIAEHATQANGVKRGNGAVVSCSFDGGDARDQSGNNIDGILYGLDSGKGKVGGGLWFRKAPAPGVAQNTPAGAKNAPPAAKPAAGAKNGFFVEQKWARSIPILSRAMAMSGDTLLVAGPPDLVNEEYAFERLTKKDPAILVDLAEQEAALEDKKGAKLLAVSANGERQDRDIDLESTPVWDGMVVARGCIFVSSVNGKVTCYGKEKR